MTIMNDIALETKLEEPHCVLSAKEFSSGAHPVWCPG